MGHEAEEASSIMVELAQGWSPLMEHYLKSHDSFALQILLRRCLHPRWLKGGAMHLLYEKPPPQTQKLPPLPALPTSPDDLTGQTACVPCVGIYLHSQEL